MPPALPTRWLINSPPLERPDSVTHYRPLVLPCILNDSKVDKDYSGRDAMDVDDDMEAEYLSAVRTGSDMAGDSHQPEKKKIEKPACEVYNYDLDYIALMRLGIEPPVEHLPMLRLIQKMRDPEKVYPERSFRQYIERPRVP